jgi:hypothetical protein
MHWLILRCIDVRCTPANEDGDASRDEFAKSLVAHNGQFPSWPIPRKDVEPPPKTRLDEIASEIWARAGRPEEFDAESCELLQRCANAQLQRGAARDRNLAEIERELERRGLRI